MKIKRIKKISKNVKKICYVTNFKQPDHFIVSRVQMWVFYSYNFWHHSLRSGSLFLMSSLVSNLYADWSRILMERQNYEELEQVFHVQPTTGCLIIHNGILILGKPWNLSGNQLISCPLDPIPRLEIFGLFSEINVVVFCIF